MYNDQILDNWLAKRADEIVAAMGTGSPLKTDDMLVLVLKAQTNHFNHLDVELRQDMQHLREDMDKRFEQVDKRFEQVDKRFDMLIGRIDKFMIWSFATTLSVGGTVIAAIKFL